MRTLHLPILLLSLFTACATPKTDSTPAQPDISGETSVKPGINETWKSDEIAPLIGRLEGESREIYAERELIGTVVGPAPGSIIADVGSGSGFMAYIFARMVGPNGRVLAVDINPTMLEHIDLDAQKRGLTNIDTLLCTEKSVELPADSVDMVFVCDTYHHFEFPKNTMRTIHSALRPGGQLIVVEFKRIPGETKEWIMDHVRAGQDVFQAEIEAAGFELIAEHPLQQLEDNYILRFRKK